MFFKFEFKWVCNQMQTYTLHDARPRAHGTNDNCINCAGHPDRSYRFGRHIYEVKLYCQFLQTYLMSFCDECDQKIIARSVSGHDSSENQRNEIASCDGDCFCERRILYIIRNAWETCTDPHCKYCVTGIY